MFDLGVIIKLENNVEGKVLVLVEIQVLGMSYSVERTDQRARPEVFSLIRY